MCLCVQDSHWLHSPFPNDTRANSKQIDLPYAYAGLLAKEREKERKKAEQWKQQADKEAKRQKKKQEELQKEEEKAAQKERKAQEERQREEDKEAEKRQQKLAAEKLVSIGCHQLTVMKMPAAAAVSGFSPQISPCPLI